MGIYTPEGFVILEPKNKVAYENWQATLGNEWFVPKFEVIKEIQDFEIRKFATHSTLSGGHD